MLQTAALAVPAWLDARLSPAAVSVLLFPILLLLMLPTGWLTPNEEYYFQLAERFWLPGRFGEYSAVFEPSYHLIASNAVIGLFTTTLGYELGNAALRVLTAAGLAVGLAWLFTAWRLSALEGLLIVAAFALLGQDLFGGEWLFLSVEAKVFAYILVLFALGNAFRGRYVAAVWLAVLATYFHLHVGGFWLLVMLGWMWLQGVGAQRVLKAAVTFAAGVFPLLLGIFSQRSGGMTGADAAEAVSLNITRIAHHIAPFSDKFILWDWTSGIVTAAGLLVGLAVLSGSLDDQRVRQLVFLVSALIVYLFVALLASTTDVGVSLLRSFLVFRPASLTLLLALMALTLVLRQALPRRMVVLGAAWVFLPAAVWSIAQSKIEEVLFDTETATRDEIAEVARVVRETLGPDQIVLIQPGRDGGRVELQLSRRSERPTFVSYRFVPSVPRWLAVWMQRDRYRAAVFAGGCREPASYPIGALLVRNGEFDEAVLAGCGPVTWRGRTHSVVTVRNH